MGNPPWPMQRTTSWLWAISCLIVSDLSSHLAPLDWEVKGVILLSLGDKPYNTLRKEPPTKEAPREAAMQVLRQLREGII